MIERRQFWRIVGFEHLLGSFSCAVQPYTDQRPTTTFSVISVGATSVTCRSYGARRKMATCNYKYHSPPERKMTFEFASRIMDACAPRLNAPARVMPYLEPSSISLRESFHLFDAT